MEENFISNSGRRGKIVITTCTIDFGDGTCDNGVTIKKGNQSLAVPVCLWLENEQIIVK
jgi:hypothetical protein